MRTRHPLRVRLDRDLRPVPVYPFKPRAAYSTFALFLAALGGAAFLGATLLFLLAAQAPTDRDACMPRGAHILLRY
jgi:hypothetical protein